MPSHQLYIDRRPLWIVLLARSSRLIFLILLAFAFFWFVNQPPWEGLNPQAYKAIGAFFLCTILWLSQLIPLAITGLLAIVVIPLLGILPAKEVFSYFGNEAVFFILGAFILSAAIMKTGLSTRLAVLFLKKTKLTPRGLVYRIFFSTAVLSCLMSEHAVAAFFFPIILEIARSLDFEPFGGEYGKKLFLAMAWGCIIGGIVTYLGGARAPLAVGMLREISGQQIGFFQWMKTTVMVALPLFLFGYLILTYYFKTDVDSVEKAKEALEAKAKKIGSISFTEFMTAIILAGSIFCWVALGEDFGLAPISIIAVVLLFVFKLVEWRDIEEYVNWGIILMYGGAIALGRAVDSSGALEWVSVKIIIIPQYFAAHVGLTTIFWLVAILSFASIFLTELFSNAAVVALLLPVSIKMALSSHVDPSVMTYAVAIPAGLGFIMPMGTPAVAIAYSSGYLRVRDIALPGLCLNLAGWFFFMLVVYFIWPLIGVNI
ncbi:MAG: hypothetical protein ACD_73C00768G0002 [uncultured bacterium]|nr:MAG: hypothetical protein ACD_73C00768G0002 [uncultured bacterium]